jgi:non-heme chloroperoxidase
VTLFEEGRFTAVSPSGPDDPETVEEVKARPEVFAHKSVGQMGIASLRHSSEQK